MGIEMPLKGTARKILMLLSDGKPRSSREVRKEMGFSRDAIGSSLIRFWKKGEILRTAEPNLSTDKIFRGRVGKTSNLRQYHLTSYDQGNTTFLYLQGQTLYFSRVLAY